MAALTLAVQLHEQRATLTSTGAVRTLVHDAWTYLCTSRPTAVNLFRAADVVRSLTDRLEASGDGDVGVMIQTIIEALEGMLEKDIQDNRAIGRWGASAILAGAAAASGNSKVAVVTHCNTGSLACAGYGTALGVVRSLHEQGRLERCYCTETRPYLQVSHAERAVRGVSCQPAVLRNLAIADVQSVSCFLIFFYLYGWNPDNSNPKIPGENF